MTNLPMVIREIHADIEAIEGNAELWEALHFDSRLDALDYLEFHVLDRLDALRQPIDEPAGLLPLQQYAQHVKRQLEAIDSALFERLRASIRTGHCRGAALLALINNHVKFCPGSPQASPVVGYDNLDVFTNGLFPLHAPPSETREREPGMVFYQKTPARIIFELVEKAQLTNEAVFYDLGSGLGHVCILVHLLSGAIAKGIEVEPAYCTYAQGCVADLNLSGVEFIQADARTADYTDGTVFFLYTPFEGRLLQTVLDRLRALAGTRPISLFTYGPCTHQVVRQRWLRCVNGTHNDSDKLTEFKSMLTD